ncbi:hypothetical protein POD33_15025 [Streptomyces moderatus]|nr:hypothetical protein POD33_15025 [Streptomyces moderatus]
MDQVLEGGGFFENFLPTPDGKKVAEHFAEAALRHILVLGESRRIRVHVLPFAVCSHALLEGPLKLTAPR